VGRWTRAVSWTFRRPGRSRRCAAIPATAKDGSLDALTERLAGVAAVRAAAGLGTRAKTAAEGAALLADGLAGGRFAPLVEQLRLREASGTALDHLRMHGAASIRLA
jgi:predicted butyrate kinase (DUF1464 family)